MTSNQWNGKNDETSVVASSTTHSHHSNNSLHRLNQHSLQQRRATQAVQEQHKMNDRAHSPALSNPESHLSWPSSPLRKGSSVVSLGSNYHENMKEHPFHESGPESYDNNNISSSPPVVTAKTARNFWKSREEIPVKAWKKPTLVLAQSPSRSSISSNGGAGGNIMKSTLNKMNFNNLRNKVIAETENEQTESKKKMNQSNDAMNHNYYDGDNSISRSTQSSNIREEQIPRHRDDNYLVSNSNIHESNNLHQQHHQEEQSKPLHHVAHKNSNKQRSHVDDGEVGEMQIKLDIAAAQLLTEEMKFTDLKEDMVKLRDDHRIEIYKLKVDLDRWKQESMAKEKYSTFVKDLELQLDQAKGELKSSKVKNDNVADMNVALQEQEKELEELYMEIERLHLSHRADREMLHNQVDTVEREKVTINDRMLDCENQIDRLQLQLQEEKAKGRSMPQSLHDSNDSYQIKEELESVKKEFIKLADETDRLEKELETVTEDRDELLRRSVLYHNEAAASSTASLQDSPIVNEQKRIASSSESELSRLRNELQLSEDTRKKQESKIQDLEKLINGHKELESLDLSAIESDSTGIVLSLEKQSKSVSLAELNKVQKECSKYKRESNEIKENLEKVEQERDNLKECMTDAMQDIEKLQNEKESRNKLHESFIEELMQIIKDRDTEISQLHHDNKNRSNGDSNASDSLREELNNMIGWIDSSTRINGSPSIECLLKDPLLVETDEKIQPFDENSNEDPAVKSLYRHVKTLQVKLSAAEEELRELKCDKRNSGNFHDYMSENNKSSEDLDESNLTFKAGIIASKIRQELNEILIGVDNDCTSNENLCKCLKEAADLIEALDKHISEIRKDTYPSESTLPSTNKADEKLQSEKQNRMSVFPNDEEQFGKLVQVSPFDLGRKDDEIVELKIEVGQLREQIKELEPDFDMTGNNGSGQFEEEMPTPTKSNRSSNRKKKLFDSSWRRNSQSTNEEDDMKARIAQSEFDKVKNELKKKLVAEVTLKDILLDTSRKLTTMTAQAETLAQQKSQTLLRCEEFEAKMATMEKDLDATKEEVSRLRNNEKDNENGSNKKNLVETKADDATFSEELSKLKLELKATAKEKRKLTKSLEEAVEMLNALQDHVLTAEKERKKLKKHLRTSLIAAENRNSLGNSNNPNSLEFNYTDALFSPDADQMENETIILQLRSHIVALDHEIRTLNDRLDENDLRKSIAMENNCEKEVLKLSEKLGNMEKSYNAAKDMLDEVTEVNKELLKDLKLTEIEEAETAEELEGLKGKLSSLQGEVDESKIKASSALHSIDNSDVCVNRKKSLVDIMNSLSQNLDALLDRTRAIELALEEKDLIILEMLDKSGQ